MPPSQRRRRPVDEDEDMEENPRPRQRQHIEASDAEQDDEASDDDAETNSASTSVDDQMAKKLVRYAISCEYSRTAIRRDGIKERVLGKQGRSFRRVFALAQTQLRTIWGMELRELPVREKTTLHEKRQAMKSNAQPKSGSGAYILTSTLPDAFRSASILAPSKVPSAEQEATYSAFYTMVVSFIWLNGGELSEQKLQRYLTRLNADRMVSSERTEVVLKRMERQGYVMKKVDRPPVGYDGDQTISWHVGPRAKEEIGLDGVMGLVREVYGQPDDDAFDKKLRSSLGIKNRPLAERGEEEHGDVGMTN
ncbi:MAGE domain-containing protein [Trichoderma longibrachiatum]|uniref:MAGE-domain-containing protein n=1 Tax=Trichoderma longibrachiatum ATCC 18648 TaxID=983965 RepID=A0A2T4CEJ1_TRILO|nr:MAGE-domain-containing protein [Trichoderma longibrachiatum ATCC 18648]